MRDVSGYAECDDVIMSTMNTTNPGCAKPMPPANEMLLIFMTLPLHDNYSNWSLLERARECLKVLYERGKTSISVVRDDYGAIHTGKCPEMAHLVCQLRPRISLF